jgi:hypothetical protein
VIALCDDGKDLLFDYANRKPVPEDPDIWVSTSPDSAPERLNKYFSVEQLSNAYVELKETGWVFCDREHQATTAAATAVALYEQFGIIPSAHALELAKAAAEAYEKALDDLVTCGKANRDVIDLLKRKETGAGLVLHPFEIRGYLQKAWSADEIERVARHIAQDLTAIQLPHSAGAEFTALLPLIHLLLLHARDSHDDFKRWEARRLDESKERFFHNDLRQFLRRHEVESEYLSFSELHNQPGRIDLAFILRHNADMKFVVELKSEDKRFQEMVNEHAGQPMAYCTHEYSRISILYAQFSGDSFRLSDAIEIRQLRPDEGGNPNPSKLAAICIGHRAFGRLPSSSGRQSTGV